MGIDLILLLMNNLNGRNSVKLVNGMDWLARHYIELLSIVRWTLPCVILFCLLICLIVPGTTETE